MGLTFGAKTDNQITELLKRYPDARAVTIPALQLAQDEFGYLTTEVMELVAARLGLPPSDVISTATFYTMLRKKPVGRHHIQVCTNIACWLRGCDAILEHLTKRLGIRLGETTPDKQFTLNEVQCLAACGTAPAMQIDDDYHEALTVDKVDEIIDRLCVADNGQPPPDAAS